MVLEQCASVRVVLAFQSPLGGVLQRKRPLVFSGEARLHDIAEVISGNRGKSLWPASFAEHVCRGNDSHLLLCSWNGDAWEPVPPFALLKDLSCEVESVRLLMRLTEASRWLDGSEQSSPSAGSARAAQQLKSRAGDSSTRLEAKTCGRSSDGTPLASA